MMEIKFLFYCLGLIIWISVGAVLFRGFKGALWRKHYRKILFFSAGLLTFIFFFDAGVTDNSDKISSFILGLTGITIFWYTRETYDLKAVSQKTLLETRKQTDYQIRPYLRLQWKARQHIQNLLRAPGGSTSAIPNFADVELINNGKGLAKNITFEKVALEVPGVVRPAEWQELSIPSISLLHGEGGASQLLYPLRVRSGFLDINANRFSPHIKMRLKFQDIEDNWYQAIFTSNPDFNDGFQILAQRRLPASEIRD